MSTGTSHAHITVPPVHEGLALLCALCDSAMIVVIRVDVRLHYQANSRIAPVSFRTTRRQQPQQLTHAAFCCAATCHGTIPS